MGQKVNPIIFRLGKTKQWKSEYVEKKSTEHSVYAFKDLEVKKFIFKSLEKDGMMVHDCKLCYTNNAVHIFISYFLTPRASSLINDINKNQKIKIIAKKNNVKKEKKYRKKFYAIRIKTKNYINNNKILFEKKVKNFLRKNSKFLSAKKIMSQTDRSLKFRRLRLLQLYKKYQLIENFQSISNVKKNSFLEKIFETVSLFTNRKLNTFVTFNQLNKNMRQTLDSKKLKSLKKNVVQLRKYKKNEFFKEGVNLIFIASLQGKFADMLAQFLSTYLKKLKRHNFFLRFIQTALTLFMKNSFSKLKGIKIKVKGRFNGAPRAKHKLIQIGNGVPVLTLNSNINYAEKTAFTSNGTFGIKVWTVEE